MDSDRQVEYPCDNCEYKRMLMRTADVHFFGDECPIECKKYDEWKEKKNGKRE